MTPLTIYRPSPDLVVRTVGEEAILVPVRHRVGDLDSVFTLNEVALRAWNLLDGKRPVDEIAGLIAGEYEVDVPSAAADLRELLATLEDARLVERVGNAN